MQPRNYSVAIEETNQTESPIFVILCVLCFQKAIFFLLLFYYHRPIIVKLVISFCTGFSILFGPLPCFIEVFVIVCVLLLRFTNII